MYKVITCKDNSEFLDKYQNIVNQNTVEMNLFVKNLNPLKIIDNNLIRGGVYKDGELVLLFLNAYPFNFLIFDINFDEQAIAEIAEYIKENNIIIRGVNARNEVCLSFIKALEKPMNLTLSMDIMLLTKLLPVEVKGILLLASEEDLALFSKVRVNFFKETMNQYLSEEDSVKLTLNDINEKTLYKFVNENNEVISVLKFSELFPSYGVISLVYTLENHRNKKYGKMMMHEIIKSKISTYPNVLLYVDKTNPISNKVYKDIGFNILVDNFDYRLND